MDGAGAGGDGRGDDLVRVEVAADVERRIGGLGVDGAAVGVGEEGDRPQPERMRGAGDANRDLAPVGDQQRRQRSLGKRWRHALNIPKDHSKSE